MSLDKFKKLVQDGEVRFVLADGGNSFGRGGSNNEIMNWVKENGKLVSYSSSNSNNQVYDLIGYTESAD